MRGRMLTAALLASALVALPACGASHTESASQGVGQADPQAETGSAQDDAKTTAGEPAEPGEQGQDEQTQEEGTMAMRMRVDDTPVNVEWEDNESVAALAALCANGPLVVEMSMYGGFEQVGSLGTSLPRDDAQTTTAAGDIVLYSGDQIVVFYGSNSWAYTRLGRVTDQDAAGMAELLGNGDVTITISTEGAE